MNSYDFARFVVALIVAILIVVYAIFSFIFKKNPFDSRFITRTAVFASLSTILYVVPYLKFPVPFFPSFLEIHFDEVPALIAGFAYGPYSAFFVILIKTIIKLPFSTTLCVGELADFLYGLIFVIPSAIIYNKKRNTKGAFISLGVGTILQVSFASFFTTFVLLYFYMFMMGISYETILGMCRAINPMVTSLSWPFLLFVALPFNLFKDVLVVLLTLLLYKKLHTIIDKISNKKTRN